MPISQTPYHENFPYRATDGEDALVPSRYVAIPTPADMRMRTLFGLPLRSFFTNEPITDEALTFYIQAAISEIEHSLDMYINPIEFTERHDYNRHLQFWSFGYFKVDHSPINTVKSMILTFNNANLPTIAAVTIPLEFIHTQPQEGTVQLVPASGVTISGFVASLYSGLGFHAFNSQAISMWPGAIEIVYEAGFKDGKLPAMLASLIENLAALKFLSSMGPILFPYNSTSIGIDGTSQSVGTLGPAFLQNRIKELQDQVDKQMDIARGYYQKKFLVDII